MQNRPGVSVSSVPPVLKSHHQAKISTGETFSKCLLINQALLTDIIEHPGTAQETWRHLVPFPWSTGRWKDISWSD